MIIKDNLREGGEPEVEGDEPEEFTPEEEAEARAHIDAVIARLDAEDHQ